jgi:hypothetical protein
MALHHRGVSAEAGIKVPGSDRPLGPRVLLVEQLEAGGVGDRDDRIPDRVHRVGDLQLVQIDHPASTV